jgi:DNA polymerase II small subunit/DNA polymerase delta subunit B
MAAQLSSFDSNESSLNSIQDDLNETLREAFSDLSENIKAYVKDLVRDDVDALASLTRMLHALKNMFEDRLRSLDKYIKSKIFNRGGQSHLLPQPKESTQGFEELEVKVAQLKELKMKHRCLEVEVQRSRAEVARLTELKSLTKKLAL